MLQYLFANGKIPNTINKNTLPLKVDDTRIDTILGSLFSLTKENELLLRDAIKYDININAGVKSGRNILDKLYVSTAYIHALSYHKIWDDFKYHRTFARICCLANSYHIPLFMDVLDDEMFKEILLEDPSGIKLIPNERIVKRSFIKTVLTSLLEKKNSSLISLPAFLLKDAEFFLICHTYFIKVHRIFPSCTVYKYLTDYIHEELYLKMKRHIISSGKYFEPNLFTRSIIFSNVTGKDYTTIITETQSGIFAENVYAKHFPHAHTIEQVITRNYLNAIDVLKMMKKEEQTFKHNIFYRGARDVVFRFILF